MTFSEPARRIVDNVLMTAVARVAMALIIPVLAVFVWIYLDGRATMQNEVAEAKTAIATTAAKVDDVNDRLIKVETKQERDTESSRQFEQEMLGRQDKMQQAIIELSNSVSALTATVKALADQKRSPP